jgi:predicted benzoate:H+ symporter BenE
MYAGMAGLLHALHPNLSTSVTSLSFNIMAVVPCLLSIVLGTLMWNGVPSGRRGSAIFQAVQIPRFVQAHLQMSLLVGTELTLRFRGPVASLWTTTGVAFQLGAIPTSQGEVIGVNLIALVAFVLTLRGAAPSTDARLEETHPMSA